MANEMSANTTISHYRVLEKLGAGGMGEVWLAEDTRLDRKVALKLLPAEFTTDADRLRRFMQEAKAASALNHPNIITVYDIGESEAGRFIVMELVAGRTLRSVTAQDYSLEVLLTLGSQMAKALTAAHAAGITHRDIKPENVMVRDDGYVKVLDFGLARLLPTTASDTEAATLAQQTIPGTLMGTVAYMSPEQASGQTVGPPSDIFALGIVLYELTTGQHPFRADTLVGYLHAIALQTPRPPSQLRAGIPAGLDGLLLRMLTKDASQRPTASEVAQALQEMERHGDTTNLRHIENETILLPTVNAGVTSADEGFWVAVLPFKLRGTNADLEALAEGLSEDIVTGLSRFSYLRVIARGSILRYASSSGDVRAIGKEVGARYVMEGNLRHSGSMLRVTVQLVDATTGANLWAETYDRPYSAEQIFALQDDLVPRIVSTVADAYGILPHSMSQAVRSKANDQLTPYESLLRSFSYVERVTAEEHADAKAALERAVRQAPGDSDSWAMLSILQTDEHIHGFSSRTGLLEQALQFARRAVDANPLNHRAYQALAWALCYRKEFDACRHAAERTVALNPMDASAMAYVGQTIAYGGGWERGCELLNRAMQLNPHHPGWYRYALFLNAYRQADYRGALDIALKMHMPGVSLMYVALAAVYGQLGELGNARAALRELLALRPDFKVAARPELEKLWGSELVDRLIDGLRKAGLEIDDEGRPEPSPTRHASGEKRADEGFWVAVLPFKYRGSNANLEALAEGLSEDIVTGLSRFSYLRVVARGSTLRYASESGDMRAIGNALGARYVMEGSLRQAGSVLRIAVQLVDASTGAHLWAETYNRTFSAEAGFELQDDIVPRIVSTVADWYGVLPHSMSEAVRLKPPDQLTPYEAVLRSFGYFERIAPEEHAAVRAGLERAVEQLPGNADGWAMPSMMYGEEHRFGFNVQPDPLGRSLQAARRAVDAAHANHFAWLALAQALYFRKEFDVFRDAAERAVALNPIDGSTVEYLGHLIAFSGDWDRGCELAERARQLNPNHPAWYWAVPFLDAYRKGDYRSARTFMLKGNQPGHFFTQALIAAVHGQLGESEAAGNALRVALTVKPDFSLIARNEFGKWYLPELVEQLIDGLRKAGLEIADEQDAAVPLPVTDVTDTLLAAAPIRRTVGRELERQVLRAAFNATKDGRGSLMCISGEPGIGKTTLVEDFLTEISAEDKCTIARGRCSERLAGTEAYLPLLDALENSLKSDENISTTMKQLAPTWYAQVVPLSGESDESARLLAEVKAASQERMKRELANFLQSVGQAQPLVLFFDDLHWADVSTIDLLSFLAGKFDALNLLIVVTYRPSDMLLAKHPFLQIKPDLQTRGLCRELLLEFLNEAEIAEYLALEFPGHSFPDEFPALIHAKTEGNPLFMADVVRYLRDRGVIALQENRQDASAPRWMLAEALPDIERELPESVRGMIERKIGQLSEEDHRLLTAAGVQGYEFDSALVARVLNVGADEVEDRLEKLERVFAFVKLRSEEEFPNHTLTLRYRFVHVLYQNALLTSLRATRKAKLSREVAQTLEVFYGERAATVSNELAALYEAGREFAKAAQYFQLAAEHAREVFAEEEAAVLASRGIEALRSLPETPERARQELALQVVLGLALRTIRGYSNSETGRAYARARELCRQIGEAPQLFPVLFGLWEFYESTGQLDTAFEIGEQLISVAGQDESLQVVAHNVMGDHLTWAGSFVAAREHLEKGIALYDYERHRSNASQYGYDSGVACLGFAAIVLWHLGYPDQALRMSDDACALASKLSHPLNVAYAAGFAAWLHSLIGSIQSAEEHADKAIAISGQYDIAMFLAWGRLMKGWSLVGKGKIEEGMALASQGASEWRATGTLLATSWCLGILAEGNLKAGRTEESRELLVRALDHVSLTGEHFYESELYRLRGESLLKLSTLDSPSDAEACFHQAIDAARKLQAKSLELRAVLSLARLWNEEGKREEARAILSEIYGWFSEGFDTADLKDARAMLDELQQTSDKSMEFGLESAPEDRLKPELHAPSQSIAVLPFVNISNDPENE